MTKRPVDPRLAREIDELARSVNTEFLGTAGSDKPVPEDAILVCSLQEQDAGEFDDNKTAPCHVCGRTLIYRPYIPDAVKKMCMPCVLLAVEAEDATKN